MHTLSTLFDHIVNPTGRGLNPDLARYLLALDFPPADHARYEELAEKAQAGALTTEERAELDDFLLVNDFLAAIQATCTS